MIHRFVLIGTNGAAGFYKLLDFLRLDEQALFQGQTIGRACAVKGKGLVRTNRQAVAAVDTHPFRRRADLGEAGLLVFADETEGALGHTDAVPFTLIMVDGN